MLWSVINNTVKCQSTTTPNGRVSLPVSQYYVTQRVGISSGVGTLRHTAGEYQYLCRSTTTHSGWVSVPVTQHYDDTAGGYQSVRSNNKPPHEYLIGLSSIDSAGRSDSWQQLVPLERPRRRRLMAQRHASRLLQNTHCMSRSACDDACSHSGTD